MVVMPTFAHLILSLSLSLSDAALSNTRRRRRLRNSLSGLLPPPISASLTFLPNGEKGEISLNQCKTEGETKVEEEAKQIIKYQLNIRTLLSGFSMVI